MDQTNQADVTPQIELTDDETSFPAAFNLVPGDGDMLTKRRAAHDDLLQYLTTRLEADSNRLRRIRRYARIDRIISTWQRLSQEDTKRQQKQDATGKAQAISMNMPLTHTHVDDMVAFFTEVYYPSTGAYGSADAIPEGQKAMREVVERMNNDAAETLYYVELSRGLRSLIKYNIGGFDLDWEEVQHDMSSDSDEKHQRNHACSLDMYNTLWDPAVTDVKDIRRKAEWAATARVANRMELVRGVQDGIYAGVQQYLAANDGGSYTPGNTSKAKYYRYPPVESNVDSQDDQTAQSSTVDWTAYGAALGGDSIDIKGGYEIVKMYCWLNPAQFGLSNGALTYPTDGFYLWKFEILAGERIISAKPVVLDSDDLTKQANMVIPWYIGFLNYDDMLGASRSIAELLAPFQSFTSFLMNAHVQGARSTIWGIKGYDPLMFDMSGLEANDGVSGYVASKQPGRDVRTGLMEIKGTFDGSKTMDQVGAMMQLTQQFFPAQAMPNQIAQMDRAVTSQVAAVLQGVSRRLQLLVKTADQMIFNPMRFDQYRNLALSEEVTATGVTDGQVRKILGSGLAQLNQEILEGSVRQMLMSIMQNQQLTQQYDISPMFEFWASLLKIPVDTSKFKLQPNPTPPVTPASADATAVANADANLAAQIAGGGA